MNTLKRRVLFLALLVVCLLGLTILGASAYTASETDVTVDNAVASVTVDATTYYYTSLDTAIADVLTNTDDDNTVTVLKDATMTNAVTLAEGTTLTIVGDGATAPVITYEGTTALFSVANKVALTFNNVTINAANSQNGIVATAGSANSDAANATTVTLTSATLNAGAKTINLTQYPYITVVATDSQILSTSAPSLYAANSGSSVITLNFEDTLIAKSIQITTLTTNFKNVALQDDATALALCNGKSSIVARLNNNKVGGEGAYKDYLTGYFTTLKDALDAAFAGSDTTTVYLLQNTTLPKHYTLTDKHLTLVGTGSTNIVLTYGGGWCFSLRGSAASITTTNLDFANCNGNVFTFGASGGSDGEYAITMTGCNVSWESASGAIYGYHSTSLAITLKDCTFTTTTRDGDAIINSSTANCKNVTMHLDNVTLAGKAIAVYSTSNPVTVTYATVAYANDAEAIADGAVARLGETASGELGKVYFKTLHEAVAAAASGSTITVLADASLTPTTITDKALTIVGSEKHTLTVVASGSHAFQLLGTEASLTLNNLVIDASQTTSASNAFFFGAKNGAASGTYAFTLSSVDVKWKTGSGAIYGYHSVKADITLTDCSFEGGSAIINTVAANATNVTMHLDNVTRVGSVAEVYSGAVVTVTRPAVNYTSDAEAIAGGAFFRLGATEGGLLGEVYFTTLNDAVAKAASGDTIYVIADATLTANFNLNAKAITVAGVSKSVKLSTSIHITLTGDASITFKDITLKISNKMLDSYTATNGNSITFNNVDATVTFVTDKNQYPIRLTSKVAINFVNSTFANETTALRTFIYGTTNAVVTSMDVTGCTFTGTRLFEGQGSCKVGTAAAPMTLTDVTSNIALFYIYTCTVYVDVFGGTYTTGFSYGGDNNAHTFVIRFNPTGEKTTTFNEIGYIARTNPLANQTSSVSVYMRNMVVNGNNANTGMFYSGRNTATFSLIFAENVVFNGANPVTEVANSAKFTITAPDVADDAAAIANKLYFRVGAAANKVYTPDLASALHAAAATGDTVYVLTNVTLSSRSYITGKTVTVEGVNADITITMPAKKEMMFIGDDAHITFKSINVVADRFVVFSQNTSGKTASLTLENGAHITNHDLAVDNDILIYNGQANAKITVNIKAGASAIVTSKTAVSAKYAVVYSGTGVSTTLNVWGTLKNLAQVPAGANAAVFTAKASTNNATLNIYDGAVIEGTSDNVAHGGSYSGIVYFSEATNVINMSGGTVTIHGRTGFSYAGTKATLTISGGTINNTGAQYAMFYGGTKTITVTGGTINCNDRQLLNSGTTVYTLENDAAAIAAGAVARISATEGGTYYGSISAAITAAANGDTIYVIRNHASGNFGVSNKKVTITGLSKDITVTNTEGTSSIFLALYDGADVTFTNIHFNVSNRFGRSDAGTHTLVFGENAKVTTNNAIFFYANGATQSGTSTATIKFLKGSVIKSTVAMGSGLIYHNQNNDWDKDGTNENRLMNLNLYIAGTLDFPSGPVYKDHNKNGTHTVYYDAKNANVTTTSQWFVDVFRTKDSNNLLKLYATGFKTTADAAAWAYNNTPATSFVYTADPAAEWAYSFIYADQLSYIQLGDLSAYGPCGRLNSYGGEVWVLRNLSSFNRTASFTDMGTVTIKSYNGATFAFQDVARIQITNTTLILDGIQLTVNSTASGAGHIKLNAGTAEKPSVLKLVNGAKITGPAWNNGQFVYLSGAYTSLYVDETSSIVENASADAMANNNTVIYASTAWANGSITIKGTVSSAAEAAGLNTLIKIEGAANNTAIVLDGATLSFTGAPANKSAVNVVANTFNGSLEMKNGAVAAPVDGFVATNEAGVLFGSITGAVAYVADGATETITLTASIETGATTAFANKNITIVAANDATITYTGTGDFFQITNLGTLTFSGLNITTSGVLVRYLTASSTIAKADRDIVINLVDTHVTANGAANELISSYAHFNKDDATTQSDSVTFNVDADSQIDFTTSSTGDVKFIRYDHNSHGAVYANIHGTVNVTVTGDSDTAGFYFVRSNNPSTTQITVSETANITITLPAGRQASGASFFTSSTGGNVNSNKLNLHLDAISDNGALTLGGVKLFANWTTACAFDITIFAGDTSMESILTAWQNKNNLGTQDATDDVLVNLITFRTQVTNGYVYGTLNAVLAAAENEGTVTVIANCNVEQSALLSGKTVTLTALENVVVTNTSTTYFVRLGDNSVLNVQNFKYQGNCFVRFDGAANTTTTLNLKSGVAITGGDPTVANGLIMARGTASNSTIVVTIEAGASVIRPASYTLPAQAALSNAIFDFRDGGNNVTLNVYGQLKNLTTIPDGCQGAFNSVYYDGANANILYSNQKNTTVNIYNGAEIEGTCNNAAHNGVYQGIFYFVTSATSELNIYGGSITAHGINPLAFFDSTTSNVKIEGAPTISMPDLNYGMVRFQKTTGTSLALGLEDGYSIDLNGKEYYCGNKPVIYAVSGITDEDAIATGMLFRYDNVYYKTLADAIALIPEGGEATIYVLAPAVVNTLIQITNKNVTIIGTKNTNYDLKFEGAANSVFFKISSKGSLTLKDLSISTCAQLVNYDANIAVEGEQADKDITVDIINCNIVANLTTRYADSWASVATLIGSSNHYAVDRDGCGEQGNEFTLNIDKDTTIDFTSSYTGTTYFIALNHNNHPVVTANISATIVVRVTDTTADVAYFVCSNNPTHTTINITEDAQITMTVAAERLAKTAFVYFTGGSVNTNKLTIHINAITDDNGASTLPAAPLYTTYTTTSSPDLCIIANSADAQASILALQAIYNTNVAPTTCNPAVFHTVAGGKYYYGTLGAMFAAAEDNGTIELLSNATVLVGASFNAEKTVTITAADGIALSQTATNSIANGATVIFKDMTINASTKLLHCDNATLNTVKFDGVTVNYTGANESSFISLGSNGKLAFEMVNGSYTSTNQTNIVYVTAGGMVPTMKYDTVTVVNGTLAMLQSGVNAVIGSADTPAEIIDVTHSGYQVFRVYDGTIYANIYGGSFNHQFLYAGDDKDAVLDIKFNPTGDKTTTVTYDTSAVDKNFVYSAWIHVQHATAQNVSLSFRNFSFVNTDDRVPMLAIRDTVNLTINVDVESCEINAAYLCTITPTSATFNSDAVATMFGFATRLNATEGGVYCKTLYNAIGAATTNSTIIVICDHATANFSVVGKKLTITAVSKDIKVTNSNADTGSIFMALYDGADVTFTSITFDVANRFGRSQEGTHKITLAADATIKTSNAIFIYANSQTPSGVTNLTFDLQSGASIIATTAMGTGLIYHNQSNDWDGDGTAENRVMNVTMYIAGTITMNGGYILNDGNSNSLYTVYYDASTATVTNTTAVWFANVLKVNGAAGAGYPDLIYAKGFVSNAAAAEWGLTHLGASAMTVSANPDREWNYTFLDYYWKSGTTEMIQFNPTQHSVLDSFGGEIWQLQSTKDGALWTQCLNNLGTVTLKSYNGATVGLQNAIRLRLNGTTLVLDGIEMIISGTASFGIYGGSAENPSALKLINGAKITINSTDATAAIRFMNKDGNGLYPDLSYASLYVDETSSIEQKGTVSGTAVMISTESTWANGSIIIKGTVTSSVTATNVRLLQLNGNGVNEFSLDGATLSYTGTATENASLIWVEGGCILNYENINNATLSLDNATAATKTPIAVRGAISFKGYTGDDAAALAAELGLGVRFGDVFSQVISTAIINQIPEGGSHTFVLSDTTYIYDPVEIYNRHITFVGTNNAAYDLIFGGAADSVMFIMVTNGSLTLKNVNISTKAQLVSYNSNKAVAGAQADKNIVINLENVKVDITISSRYVNDVGYAGALISSSNHYATNRGGCGEQSNSITVNIDKDTVINYTSTYANSWLIAFNHNAHKNVYANIYGTVNMTTTYNGSDASIHLIHSNNPSYTEVVIGETANIRMNFSASTVIQEKSTAYIATSSTGTAKMTIYLRAFIENGELMMDGLRLFSAHVPATSYQTMIIADNDTFAAEMFGLVAYQSNSGGTAYTETPIVASLAQDGKVYFSSLGGVVSLIPEGGSGTITIDKQITFSSEIAIHDRDITIVGSPNFQGDYHLKFTGSATKWAFAIYGKGTLTLKDLRIHTTGILVDFNANKKVSGAKADKNTIINLVNTDVVAEGAMGSVFASRQHYSVSGGSGEQSNKVVVTIDADSSVVMTTSTTGNIWFFSFNHNTHVEMNAYVYGSITINATGTPAEATERTVVRVNNPQRHEMIFYKGSNLVLNFTDNTYKHYLGVYWTGTSKLIMDMDAITDNGALTLDGALLFCASPASCIPTIGITGAADTSMQNTMLAWQGNFGGIAVASHNYVTPISFRSESNGTFAYGCIGGAAYAAQDGSIITLLRPDFSMTPTTITNKTITLKGLEDGYIIRNNTTSYLLNIGSGAHLTIEGLTFIGNYIAQFTAAANTECSLTLGENTHIVGGDLADKAYIMGGSGLYGSATITISKTASIIRPDSNTITATDTPSPSIYRFETRGHYTLNVYGQLKNLTSVAEGIRASATIGYANVAGGMIVNIYDGAKIEATNDSTAYNGYYQGVFYFASAAYNRHEFNVYGGHIVSHGINSLAYFGNNYATIRLEGSPIIEMRQATYNMFCIQPNTTSYPLFEFVFTGDLETDAVLELNGRLFCWGTASPAVSKFTVGKFFTDDNAAQFGVGYRVVDENGDTWYTVSLGAAATLSRNGGTIYLVGDMTDAGSSVVLDKYLFLEPVKPGLTIKLNGSNLFAVTSGTKDAPVRMYIKDITFTGSCTGVLFAVSGSANAIFVLDNCNMNGTAGVIRLSGTATASVTLNKGNYTLKNYPFNAIDYSNLTVNATDITFVTTGTSNEHSLFFLNNKAIGTFNIKGGSATTAFHTFYTMDTSTAYVNIENFSIITSQWGLGSQSSTVWYVNLKNVDIHAKNTTAARLYAANGSYINIMGGKFSTAKKDGTNPATLTFGNAITVNIFDAYIASPYMSAISGLTKTVNINIYGGTYIYNGTEAGYAPIMLPKEGNLTVKGGTFINQSGLGPVFSNTVYTNNVLTLEGYNAISNSSNLILNFSDKGTPSANLGAYGRLTLNSLAMTRGARPAFVGENGAMTFKSTVSKSAYEYMQSLAVANEVKFGMLVIRTDLLKNIDDFTHAGLAKYSNAFGDNLELGVDYFDYKASANDYTFHDDGCVTIKLTHSGITDFTAEYSVVFYAEYDVMATIGVDENDNPIYAQTGTTASGKALYSSTVYRYADYEESENARSLADVAYAALQNSANESFTEAEVAKLSTWCGAQNAEKTLDIFLVAGGSNAVGNTPYSKQYAESIINHQCAECGHIADNALFAASTYTCVNKLVHGKPLTIADDKCFCSCGYIYDEETGIPGEIDPETGDILTYIVEPYTAIEDLPEGLTCPATRICGAAKATFRNVLKNSNPNVLYSGIISQKAPQDYGSSIVYATASKYFPVGSAPTLGLGWNADMIGPEYGMATELAKHYTGNKYAVIMKYAMNDAALVTEDAYYSNFARKLVSNADEKEALIDKLADGLYKNFVKMVADQIATYADLGYKVNIAGLYWMQGEADLANSAAYAEALQQLIANIRSDLSTVTGSDLSTLPVVVGEVATFTGTTGNTNRVAMKDAQNTVTGVMIDKTSAYMADTNGIFVNAQDITATGARVIAKILKTKNDQIVIPEVENTTVITDKEGNPIAGLTGHTSLAMSLIAAPSGAVITLKEDQTVYTAMNLINSSDVVINGDGKTITVVTDAPAIALQNASVTLANVAIEHTGSSAAITLDQSSGLTIEEDTVITAERTVIEMTGNASNLVINGGTFTTTAEDATTADAIIRTSNANVTITDGFFQAADGSSILSIDKNAAHRLIVNIKGGTFETDDRQVEKIDADGDIIVGEYDTIEAIAFVNNCPTAILVIDPDVLAAHPELRVLNAAH